MLLRPKEFACLLPLLSIKTLQTLELVSHSIRDAVRRYITERYNVNALLSEYTSHPLAFRHLQARTGFLISGPAALQFFSGGNLPKQLDLYVAHSKSSAVTEWIRENSGRNYVEDKRTYYKYLASPPPSPYGGSPRSSYSPEIMDEDATPHFLEDMLEADPHDGSELEGDIILRYVLPFKCSDPNPNTPTKGFPGTDRKMWVHVVQDAFTPLQAVLAQKSCE